MPLIWFKKHRPEVVRGILSTKYEKKAFWKNPFVLGASTFLCSNFLTKPDFIAYNHLYKENLSRVLTRKLYGALSVAWTIKSENAIKENEDDFDLFIFDSFVPLQKPAAPAKGESAR